MKKLIPLIFLVVFVGVDVRGQLALIPDPNFRAFLQVQYPSCFVNDSLDTQCSEVVQESFLDLSNTDVIDLSGLEYFANLEHFKCKNNDLTTLSNLPNSLIILDVRNNLLSSLPSLPSGLVELLCNTNQLTSLPLLPSTLSLLNCSENSLIGLPPLPSALGNLYCAENSMSELPTPLPASLGYLDCGNNQLVSLPSFANTNIQTVLCNDNLLSSLPIFSNTLTWLDCSHNSLTALSAPLSSNLSTLKCSNNQLTTLPQLPMGSYTVDCSYNNITALPQLANLNALDLMNCSHNLLTELPDFNNNGGIYHLDCGYNQLTSIPPSAFGNHMYVFNCEHNYLTELPSVTWAQNSDLDGFFCNNNSLTALPTLPSRVDYLNCDSNQIEVLPELPWDLHTLSCRANNLSCLPILPDVFLQTVLLQGNDIVCLPNDPESDPYFDVNLPICTSNNPHDCTFLRLITGTVAYDLANDCEVVADLGLRNRVVSSSYGTYAISDTLGRYELYAEEGTWTVDQHDFSALWNISCQGIPYEVEVGANVDSIPDIDFPNQALGNCHWLQVDLSSGSHVPCRTSNHIDGAYCNYGNAVASDVYIDLELPVEVVPLSGSHPWTDMGDGVIRIELGDLGPDDCGTFFIQDSVLCNATPGWTVCVSAEIGPLSPCYVGSGNWDGSSLAVDATCTGSNVEFSIENVGSGNMNAPTTYRIFEDDELLVAGQPVQLNAGQSLPVPVIATGRTYRLEVDQSPGHPGWSLPRRTVERCGTPPYSLGLINQSTHDDADDHLDIECTELAGPYDPNDKTVVPSGHGAEHFIATADSLLEYRIRFQNTGTAPAINVEVVDSLPIGLLDPLTFLSGVSSHPYTVRMHGAGIVTWRFENIMLPDSGADLAGSQGFVKFKIRTQPGLQPADVIRNRAAIYFDYNAPIITNTSFLTISDQPIWVSDDMGQTEKEFHVSPNPFDHELTVQLNGTQGPVRLTIYDMMGRVVRQELSDSDRFVLQRNGLLQGIYLLEVSEHGTSIGTVRVVVL